MKVEKIMTSPARSCLPHDALVTAAEIMWDADCGCVPVVDEERHVVGVITDRDISMTAHLSGESLRTGTVGSIMATDVCACSPNDTLQDAAELMAERQLRRLPVVDDDGRLVGVVSLNDLALACQRASDGLSAADVAQTLAAISRHRPSFRSAEPH